MAGGQTAVGIAKIELAPIVNGGVGTVWTQLPLTLAGSASIATDAGDTTTINAEETDTPIYTSTTPGATTIPFTIANPDADTRELLQGGTVTTTNGVKTWNAPRGSVAEVERSMRITMKTGHVITVPRAKLTSVLDGPLAKTDALGLPVTATILLPADGTTSPISISDPVVG